MGLSIMVLCKIVGEVSSPLAGSNIASHEIGKIKTYLRAAQESFFCLLRIAGYNTARCTGSLQPILADTLQSKSPRGTCEKYLKQCIVMVTQKTPKLQIWLKLGTSSIRMTSEICGVQSGQLM